MKYNIYFSHFLFFLIKKRYTNFNWIFWPEKGGEQMSVEIIRQIRESEAQSENMKQEAQAKARQILNEARELGTRKQEEIVQEARGQASQIREQAAKEAQARYEEILSQAKAQDQEIEKKALSQMEQAVDIIVGRIVNSR